MADSHDNQFSSRFLDQLFSHLAEATGDIDGIRVDTGQREQLTLFLFPLLVDGIPAYNLQDRTWEFFSGPEGPSNLMVDIFSDGHLQVRPGDDDGVYLHFIIDNPEEIDDVVFLLTQLTEDNASTSEAKTMTLNELVSGVFLLVPYNGGHRLLPFGVDCGRAIHSDIARIVRAFYSRLEGDWEFLGTIGYSDWGSWVEDNVPHSTLEPLAKPLRQDLIYSRHSGLCTYRRFLAYDPLYRNLEPPLVLQLADGGCVPMFFCDYQRHAQESETIISGMCSHLDEIPHYLQSVSAEIPTSKLEQVRRSIELRTAKCDFRSHVDGFVNLREPFAQIVDLYQRRVKYIDFIWSEYHNDIEAAVEPLPFFLEYPYRRFKRAADDPGIQIECAKMLLNICVKILILLPMEEGNAVWPGDQRLEKLHKDITSHSHTDGQYLRMNDELPIKCPDLGAAVNVFSPLCGDGITLAKDRLRAIVDVRNRYSHPPYDRSEFLRVSTGEYASVIRYLRAALRGVRFVVPHLYRERNGSRQVFAEMIMGHDPEFMRQWVDIEGPFEDYPSGKLIAVKSGARRVDLSRYFRVRQTEPRNDDDDTKTIDIGLFDWKKGDEEPFDYVRELTNSIRGESQRQV